MAITFQKENKAKEYIMLAFLIVLALVALFFIWKIFVEESTREDVSLEEFRKPHPKINVEVLLDPKINDLQLFEDIQPTDLDLGRENPFSSALI